MQFTIFWGILVKSANAMNILGALIVVLAL